MGKEISIHRILGLKQVFAKYQLAIADDGVAVSKKSLESIELEYSRMLRVIDDHMRDKPMESLSYDMQVFEKIFSREVGDLQAAIKAYESAIDVAKRKMIEVSAIRELVQRKI